MRKKIMIAFILMLSFVIMPNVKAIDGFWSGMPNGSYIIGEYLYTRNKLEDYSGQLKTEYIMMASQSIDGEDLSTRILYYKTPRGILTNGLTGEELDIDESDLLENVKYYNGKRIPNISMTYLPQKHPANNDYYLHLNFDYEDSQNTLDSNYIKWDIYGAKEWDGAVYNPEMTVTSDDDSTLKLIKSNAPMKYAFTLANGKYYSYVGFPYFYDGEEKIYLDNTDGITIYGGAEIDYDIDNHKINVTVSGINDNFTITQAALYASRRNVAGTHIDMKDIHTFTKNNPNAINQMSNDFIEFFTELSKQKKPRLDGINSNFDYYLADIYMTIGTTQNKQSVEMYDFGNSEHSTPDYIAEVTISSPNILNGRPITVTTLNSVISTHYVDQPSYHELDDNVETLDLFGFLNFISSLKSGFENMNIDDLLGGE